MFLNPGDVKSKLLSTDMLRMLFLMGSRLLKFLPGVKQKIAQLPRKEFNFNYPDQAFHNVRSSKLTNGRFWFSQNTLHNIGCSYSCGILYDAMVIPRTKVRG